MFVGHCMLDIEMSLIVLLFYCSYYILFTYCPIHLAEHSMGQSEALFMYRIPNSPQRKTI